MLRISEIMEHDEVDRRTLNFDQTSVARLRMKKRTIDQRGKKEILTTNPPCTKENFTVGQAVPADGTKEKAVVVFKATNKNGQLSERIKKSLRIPQNVIVYGARKAWWNSELDLQWIEEVFPDEEGNEENLLMRDHFQRHYNQERTFYFRKMSTKY